MTFNTHLAYKPAIPFIDMYPKEMKSMPAQRLHTNVHGSFYHASHKLEIIQIHQEMNRKANFAYSYNRYYSAKKNAY